MSDPTDSLALLAPPTSPDLARLRLLLILREVPAIMAAHLSLSQRMLAGAVVNQMVGHAARAVAQMSDAQTTQLLHFLRLTLRDVDSSDLADDEFTARFRAEYAALDDLFTNGGAA